MLNCLRSLLKKARTKSQKTSLSVESLEEKIVPTITGLEVLMDSPFDTTPVISMDPHPDAARYEVSISNRDSGQTVLLEQYLGDDSLPVELPGGNYLAYARYFDSNGAPGIWSDSVDFSIFTPAPGKAKLTGPQGIVDTDQPTFHWNKTDHASSYQLFVYNNDTGETLINFWVKDTSYTARWQLQLLDSHLGQQSVWSLERPDSLRRSGTGTRKD